MKYCIIFLIIGCFYILRTEANNISSKISIKTSKNDVIYHLLRNFIKTCDFGTRKVIAFDDTQNLQTFTAINELQPQISVSLFTDRLKLRRIGRYQFDDLKVDAVIVVYDVERDYEWMTDYFHQWHYNRDCIVYIFPVPLRNCTSYKYILELIMKYYFPKAYFICLMNEKNVHIYTHDPYGDIKPLRWNKIEQYFYWGKNRTLYERSCYQGSNMSLLCPGFNFERTDPSNQKYIIFGLHLNQIMNKSNEIDKLLNDDEVELHLIERFQNKAVNSKKLTKLKFKYYIGTGNKAYSFLQYLINETWVDAIFRSTVMISTNFMDYFYPIIFDDYAIISYHQGLMTPLEKIAQFYGKWTISSLMIIITITFTVMWLSTKKPSLAFFNIIRLLINAEIITPIATGSLKLFFSMIFLYFLVIHATFSGHLAEFLTKVKYRPNIDTLEQLNNPKIEKIYNFGYKYDLTKKFDVLRLKSEVISISTDCNKIRSNPNSVCIAPMAPLVRLRSNSSSVNTFYISKKTFGSSLFSYVCKRGFPLREKFNWAIITLTETGNLHRDLEIELQAEFKKIAVYHHLSHIEYRKITVRDLLFAFIFLIIGNCVGFICFICEIMQQTRYYNLKLNVIKKNNAVSIEVKSH